MTADELDLPGLAAWGNARVPNALFWTVSGSHLYGFSSADSDIDLRGCFLAPVRDLVGLRKPAETHEPKGAFAGVETEAVSHELGKYLRLMCANNGYVLEQIFSPHVAFGAEFLARLRPVAARCVTRNCYYHYRGFLKTQREQFEKQSPKRAKTLLYAYRVALTGIHLLETGEVESHLPTLNAKFGLPFIGDLIAQKERAEAGALTGLDVAFHEKQMAEWDAKLESAFHNSRLPHDAPMNDAHEFALAVRGV